METSQYNRDDFDIPMSGRELNNEIIDVCGIIYIPEDASLSI